jgi:hypothetical protein
MTDRVHSLTVVLDSNYRDDDVQGLIDAIQQFRGVVSVGKNVSDPTSYMAEQRARTALQDRVREVLWPTADREGEHGT